MRLIDADRLETVMSETIMVIIRNPKMDNQEAHILAAFHTVGVMVDDAPTIEAEPVVRCKDCKFNYANQIPSEDVCQLCVELPISKDFYCAYGERTDEFEEPEINPCRGCSDYDGKGGCISNGGCGERKDDADDD